MVTKKNFGIIGGDFRQIYLAKKLRDNDNKVFLYGFDKLESHDTLSSFENVSDVINNSDYVVFPLPTTRDNISLNMPLSESKVIINEELLNLLHKKIIFGDLTKFIKNADNYRIYDYSKNEEFKIMNAIPTAEGAIQSALRFKNQTLFKSNCLVAGFGRIGKILANRLEKFNANITVTARKNSDLIWANALGYNYIPLTKVSDKLASFDFVFNTIPKIIFDEIILSKCNKNVLIIDVASMPGGIDKTAAEKLNVDYRHELGIPGSMFPKTAADIIYNSIAKIIEEETL